MADKSTISRKRGVSAAEAEAKQFFLQPLRLKRESKLLGHYRISPRRRSVDENVSGDTPMDSGGEGRKQQRLQGTASCSKSPLANSPSPNKKKVAAAASVDSCNGVKTDIRLRHQEQPNVRDVSSSPRQTNSAAVVTHRCSGAVLEINGAVAFSAVSTRHQRRLDKEADEQRRAGDTTETSEQRRVADTTETSEQRRVGDTTETNENRPVSDGDRPRLKAGADTFSRRRSDQYGSSGNVTVKLDRVDKHVRFSTKPLVVPPTRISMGAKKRSLLRRRRAPLFSKRKRNRRKYSADWEDGEAVIDLVEPFDVGALPSNVQKAAGEQALPLLAMPLDAQMANVSCARQEAGDAGKQAANDDGKQSTIVEDTEQRPSSSAGELTLELDATQPSSSGEAGSSGDDDTPLSPTFESPLKKLRPRLLTTLAASPLARGPPPADAIVPPTTTTTSPVVVTSPLCPSAVEKANAADGGDRERLTSPVESLKREPDEWRTALRTVSIPDTKATVVSDEVRTAEAGTDSDENRHHFSLNRPPRRRDKQIQQRSREGVDSKLPSITAEQSVVTSGLVTAVDDDGDDSENREIKSPVSVLPARRARVANLLPKGGGLSTTASPPMVSIGILSVSGRETNSVVDKLRNDPVPNVEIETDDRAMVVVVSSACGSVSEDDQRELSDLSGGTISISDADSVVTHLVVGSVAVEGGVGFRVDEASMLECVYSVLSLPDLTVVSHFWIKESLKKGSIVDVNEFRISNVFETIDNRKLFSDVCFFVPSIFQSTTTTKQQISKAAAFETVMSRLGAEVMDAVLTPCSHYVLVPDAWQRQMKYAHNESAKIRAVIFDYQRTGGQLVSERTVLDAIFNNDRTLLDRGDFSICD